jgi:hypothetical protein
VKARDVTTVAPASRWRRWAALVVVAGALAAAVALYLSGGPTAPSLSALPAYRVTAHGESVALAPSDPASAARLRIGSGVGAFEVLLRPAEIVAYRVVAYAFVAAEAGEPRAAAVELVVSPDGAVRVSGPVSALGDAAELRVVVGSPDVLTSEVAARDRARTPSSPSRGLRVVVVAIER